MENLKFARQCKKSNGYFKCCLSYWRVKSYEITRNKLIDAGLLKGKKTKFCRVTKSGKSTYHFCSSSGICSKKHSLKRAVDNTYYPENNKFEKGNSISWDY